MSERSGRGEEAPSETVHDLVARTHAREGSAIVAPDRATDYSARAFATGVRKAANLFSHYGVGPDRPLAVAVGPTDPADGTEAGRLGTAADPLLAILGGMVLGAPVDPDPGPAPTGTTLDVRALVVPTPWLDRYEVGPGTSVLAYGDPPEDPNVGQFERERWSENPTAPPEPLEPGRAAMRVGDSRLSHADLVGAAEAAIAASDLRGAAQVRVAAPIDSPEVFVTGILAPLLADVPIRPAPASRVADAETGVFAVSAGGDERWMQTQPIP
jgi:hypothetical protein